jgi:hypothetical protein
MKVAISNFSPPISKEIDFEGFWSRFEKPEKKQGISLFENDVDWGFHIYSLGVHLMEKGIADEVEFWDYSDERGALYHSNGILRILFYNEEDVLSYLERFGYPNLYVNHGRNGLSMLRNLDGKCFRVHVPASRRGLERQDNHGAECYLVDAEKYLDERSMLYTPVVNIKKIYPDGSEKQRDFIYLASNYPGKRHDIVINAVRGTPLTGHFHPVDGTQLDLSNTNITTSAFNTRSVVELLRTSRIAVYPGDHTSNPAAMWECVAAGLPIVVNENIDGGKHLVVPGVTGEFASEDTFRSVMESVLTNLNAYRSREYFINHWDTIATVEKYLAFFRKMGWTH